MNLGTYEGPAITAIVILPSRLVKKNSLEKYRTQIHNPGLSVETVFGSTSSRNLIMRELNSYTPNPLRVTLEKYPALESLVLPLRSR